MLLNLTDALFPDRKIERSSKTRLGSDVADVIARPEDEGAALAAALLDGLPDHWDGFVEASWVRDTPTLDAAVLAGQLRVRVPGRQAPRGPGEAGAARSSKFEMQMRQARQGLRVARHDWP